MIRRNSTGQFRRSYRKALSPLFYLSLGILFLGFIWIYNQKHELLDPCDGCTFSFSVRAYEEPVVEKPKTIKDIVVEVFRDDSEDALKIMYCESRNNPETIGDTHIMSINQETGELVGDSIGLFQIRTGSTNWNRAARNNMTAEEFRGYLKDAENNIKYAKTIFDRRGWSGWFNCMNKVL